MMIQPLVGWPKEVGRVRKETIKQKKFNHSGVGFQVFPRSIGGSPESTFAGSCRCWKGVRDRRVILWHAVLVAWRERNDV